jgi:signal transduction histidine kinase
MRDGWQIASILVGAGLTVEQLETLKVMMGTEHLPPALDWLAQSLTASTLLYTLEQSTSRAVELIEAFKAYSYMDRSSRQEINIHEGIENTLLILSHKLKDVTVIREYEPNLPRITAYGPELNQVWTNLIDNAIAATEGRGHIWIRTALDEDRVQIEIVDDGPGIPPDIQSRVFDPFFTTKPIGEGTGLGLDITYRIIVEQHHGSIQLFSEPGQTCFKICLPIHQP